VNWRRTFGLAVGVLTSAAPAAGAQIVGPSTGGAAALAQAERMLGHTKRVLMIGAHPDDEDTELLTYLVRHDGAEAAYLALTRGEGGQNLIGPELGDALGLIRTEELLGARRLDGARQYFSRAFDFGFSKTITEAFRFWPRDTVLKDVVRIIRRFRPQIVVSIFSGAPRDGHGQHQVAGWAARAAFDAAGDPARFPELQTEEGLAPWTPRKLYRSARFDTTGTSITLDGGLLDPEIGQSYRQIAMRGRSLHRSQDMGMLQEIGPSLIRLALVEDRTGGGAPLFAGIDTMPPPPGATTIEARDLARHGATAAAIKAGVIVDAIADQARLVPGSTVHLRLSLWNAGQHPVSGIVRLGLRPGWQPKGECLGETWAVEPDAIRRCDLTVSVPEDADLTTPYFLAQPRVGALYQWSGPPSVWGEPFGPPLITARFTVSGPALAPIELTREVVERIRDQAIGELRKPLAVVPRVDVKVSPETVVWPVASRAPEKLTVTLQHAGDDTTRGTVHLDLPAGWPAVAPVPFELDRADERRAFTLSVRAPAGVEPGTYAIRAFARDRAGKRYDTGVVMVSYPHIRDRGYTKPSTVTVHAADVALPVVAHIGYVRGAADRVPEALAGVGVHVDLLDAVALDRGDLSQYDVIVIGSRAYETDPALIENNGRLLDYVKGGGHVVVQYQQQPYFEGDFAPYPLTVARPHDRVTDETAPVRLLAPDDPVFQSPNRIGPSDWNDWIQERGLYFAHTWDSKYRPLLEMADPGEAPLQGGMLLTTFGKGTYLYTGLAFFRQLPAGVPGAFRLFFNLLDLRSRDALP
jgi:LmbE family N-acetylglucosaminyl deacetylase